MPTADQSVGHVVRPPSSELPVVADALDETVDSFLTQRNETAPDFKAAAALAALLRSLGFEKVTVVLEQPPAT
jgi:hypothetical protein